MTNILWVALLAAELGLAYRIWRDRLSRAFPFLAAWVAVAATENLIRLAILVGYSVAKLKIRSYDAKVYYAAEYLLGILTIGVVREIWVNIAHEHRALARVGGMAVIAVASVSFALAAIVVVLKPSNYADATMHLPDAIHSATDGTTTLFLLTMLAFVSWFPVTLASNVVFYFRALVITYLSSWAIGAVNAAFPSWLDTGNALMVALQMGAKLYLMAGLRELEFQTMRVTGPTNAERAAELRQRLQYLDHTAQDLLGRFG